MTTQTVQKTLDRRALDSLFAGRHTTNTFTDIPVDAKLVQAAYDDARFAPISMNSQPLRLTLVEKGQPRLKLVEHMMDGNKAKTEAAPLSIVVAYDPDWHLNMDELFPAVPGVRENLASQPENRHAMGRDNAFIQFGYLLLALRAYGLEVGPMTGIDAAGIDAAFHTENGWKAIAVVNVGHAPNPEDEQAQFPRGKRLEFSEISQTR
ncbi:malonic semialdehyde reductase [Nesterenkonia ebinurensis]|uniref:malonic semialdehyde reductase n=1 Tax=Nesterenkonia ebinurensis TaxID=2608252 RepID=UPI00123E37AD|nr:malonic semialdehyde reductase [Nesterenkonia ebinurensis]